MGGAPVVLATLNIDWHWRV